MSKEADINKIQNKENADVCQKCKNVAPDKDAVFIKDFLENNNIKKYFERNFPEIAKNSISTEVICKGCIALSKIMDSQSHLEKTVDYSLTSQIGKSLVVKLTRMDVSKVDTQNVTKNINRKQNEIKVGSDSFYIPLVLNERFSYFCENCKFGDKCGHAVPKWHNVFEPGMFYCANCDYKTNNKYSLKYHMLVHKTPFETKTFKCSKCKYETKHKSGLNSHSLTHKSRNETRMYACNDCDFESKHRHSIKGHVKVHRKKEEIETFNCTYCDYKAKCKGNLRTHLISHQTPQLAKWYNCDKCSFKTRYKANFRRHLIVHQAPDQVRFYKCQFCEYKSKHLASVNKHLFCHDTGDVKIYSCFECTYETKHKNNFHRHVLSHKKYGEVSMLKCPECDYETNNKSYLSDHQKKRHNPQVEEYRCTQCEYSTVYKGNLTKHEVIHQTGSVDCPLCDHKAKSKNTLKLHMSTHNRKNASKNKCPYCDFKTYHSISRHVFRIHGIKLNKSRDHLRKYKPPQTPDEN